MISAEDDQTFPCSSGTFTHAFKLEGVEAAGGKSEAMCRDEDERTYLTSSQYVTAPSKTPVPQTNVFDSDNLDKRVYLYADPSCGGLGGEPVGTFVKDGCFVTGAESPVGGIKVIDVEDAE
ncbi:hypothetical protein Q7P36_004389 [Cladosporium allicinum]